MNTINATRTSASKFNTKYMVELALMVAVILVMSLTPLGYIRTPGLSITLLTVPVAVGAIILGPDVYKRQMYSLSFGCILSATRAD